MTRAFMVAAICLSVTAVVSGQSATYVTPRVTIAATYDDNILWLPDAQSDHVWYAEPACSILRETPRGRFWFDGSTAASWYDRYRPMSSFVAGQHARMEWSQSASPMDAL